MGEPNRLAAVAITLAGRSRSVDHWMLMPEPARLQSLAEQVTAKLAPLLQAAFDRFVDEHPDEEFYSFALVFDAAAPGVALSANTEEKFATTLEWYQNKYGPKYRFEEGIRSLRFNSGDWGYSAFACLYEELFDATEQGEVAALWPDSWEEDTLDAMSEVLVRFRETESFERMQKTQGFVSFSIGDDPDFLGALGRMDRIGFGYTNEREAASKE